MLLVRGDSGAAHQIGYWVNTMTRLTVHFTFEMEGEVVAEGDMATDVFWLIYCALNGYTGEKPEPATFVFMGEHTFTSEP